MSHFDPLHTCHGVEVMRSGVSTEAAFIKVTLLTPSVVPTTQFELTPKNIQYPTPTVL